ncbi:hypothetical protein Hypma_015787 [Hypsizygus marmoreus]|uniref:DUF7721 domain-containing protein n=1 Tax=Hypsizygus marmoreus TaxID=39966 RepID=A0A369K215_HYPMA|nr:hypothetical protein Hypma_015787 [Hypsizygus marmoreus]
MSTNPGTIFNVPEAQGTERVGLETTAANAQIEAANSSVAREVEANAEQAQDVAHDAADAAKSKGPDFTGTPPSAIDQFEQQAKKKTDAAVAEGQHDVEAVKAASAGFIDEVKALAASAISTVESYLAAGVSGHPTGTQTGESHPSGIVPSLQSGAATAVETAKQYLASAQEVAHPHIEHAKDTAQGYLGIAETQPTSQTPASSTGIPATSAVLESGPHTVDTPYPSTTTTAGTNVEDSFMNLAKKGYEAYSDSQTDVSKTGGHEFNSPDNTAKTSGNNVPSFIDPDEAVQSAQKEGSGERSLFETALGFLGDNKKEHEKPLDEESVTRAHEKAYTEGNAGNLSASSLGSAAALQVLKQFTSGGKSSGSGSQTQLISMAMAEATKLFDKSGGAASGNKQDAVNGAAMTVMKLLVQSKFGGGGSSTTIGGSNSGGLSGLMSLASKFTK